MDREPVVIFGCGGLGRLVQDILVQSARYVPIAYLDSDAQKHGRLVDGLPVCGGIDDVAELSEDRRISFVVAVGENCARVNLARQITERGGRLASAIHPSASLSSMARMGEHMIVGARATVCVNSSVGAHSILSAGSIIDHDSHVGIGVHIHPAVRIAGGVTIEDFVTLEIGACVIPDLLLKRGATARAGAVVIRNVDAHQTIDGMPGRPVGRRATD